MLIAYHDCTYIYSMLLPICGETEETRSSILCRFLIYLISIQYKFSFSCFIYLNIKSGYAKKHSHHEGSPEAILTLLQPPLIGRTHLYYYDTKKGKIVNTIYGKMSADQIRELRPLVLSSSHPTLPFQNYFCIPHSAGEVLFLH